MPNFLNNRIVPKTENKNESNGLIVIAFPELHFTKIGAYYPSSVCEMNIKTTAPKNTLQVLERDTSVFRLQITEPYLLFFI